MDAELHFRLMDVFLAASELEERRRGPFLDRTCGRDSELRREVESLLKFAGGETVTPLIEAEGGEEIIPQQGSGSERYELLGSIARGGTAEILRALDTTLEREVALKVPRDEHLGKADVARRLAREAVILGKLQHPGVPPVHDLGRLPDGRPFIALKLVRGNTLAWHLERRKACGHQLSRWLEVFERVSETMAFAHAQGIIHRDLKPANVMVDEFGEVQIMDWGLTKRLGEAGLERERPPGEAGENASRAPAGETRLGALMGTPGYMAPERALGRRDKRTDVFELGAIFCEILTGKPPFTGETVAELCRKSAEGDLAEALALLDACGADAALIEVAKSCLALDPEARPKDAGVVARRINAYRRSVDDRVRDAELAATRAEAKAKEERKRRFVTLLAAALSLLLILGGGGGWLWFRDREASRMEVLREDVHKCLREALVLREKARVAPVDEIAPWVAAHGAAARAAALAAESLLEPSLKTQIQELLDDLGRERREHELIHRLEAARLASTLELDQAGNDGALRRQLERVLEDHGWDLEADRPEESAWRIGALCPRVSESLITKLDGWLLLQRSEKRRESKLLRVLESADRDPWRADWRRAVMDGDRDRLLVLAGDAAVLERPEGDLVNLGLSLGKGGRRLGEAIAFMKKVRNVYPGSFWTNHWLAEWLTQLDATPAEQAELAAESLRYSEAAAAVSQNPEALVRHGMLLEENGNTGGAEAVYRQAMEMNPGSFKAYMQLSMLLMHEGRIGEAVAEMETAVASLPRVPVLHAMLGGACQQSGQLERAETSLLKALELSFEDPEATGSWERRRHPLPYSHYKAVVRFYEQTRKEVPLEMGVYLLRGLIFEGRGKRAGAMVFYEKAERMDPENPQPKYLLGALFGAEGVHLKAIEIFREALALDARPHRNHGRWNYYMAGRSAILEGIAEGAGAPAGLSLRREGMAWWRECLRVSLKFEKNGFSKNQLKCLDLMLRSEEFGPVRDRETLEALPKEERESWREFWEEIRAACERVF